MEAERKKLLQLLCRKLLNGVKIEAGYRVIEDFHVGNDAELDKGWLSGWREEWMPSRCSLEMKMDGLVIGLAMDINGSSQGRFIYSKQIKWLRHSGIF